MGNWHQPTTIPNYTIDAGFVERCLRSFSEKPIILQLTNSIILSTTVTHVTWPLPPCQLPPLFQLSSIIHLNEVARQWNKKEENASGPYGNCYRNRAKYAFPLFLGADDTSPRSELLNSNSSESLESNTHVCTYICRTTGRRDEACHAYAWPRDNSHGEAPMQMKNRVTKIGDYSCCAIARLMISTYNKTGERTYMRGRLVSLFEASLLVCRELILCTRQSPFWGDIVLKFS